MKKLCILVLMVFCFCTFVGCAKSPRDVAELEQKIASIEKENAELREKLEEYEYPKSSTMKDEASPTSTRKDFEKSTENIATVNIEDTIRTDNIEVKINKIEFSYDVAPENPDMFYTHYAADAGQVFIHLDVDVKNLQKKALECDKVMGITANYNDGYTYTSIPIVEDGEENFTYANISSIDPLQTIGMRFLIDCPQEVEETSNPLFLIFELDNEKYKYTIR